MPSPSSAASRPHAVQILLVGLAYALAAWAGFRLLSVPGSVAIIWPAAGVLRRRPAHPAAPHVAADGRGGVGRHRRAADVDGRAADSSPVCSRRVGVAETLLAAWLLVRWRPSVTQFSTMADMFALASVGALVSVVVGGGGAALVAAVGHLGGAGQPRVEGLGVGPRRRHHPLRAALPDLESPACGAGHAGDPRRAWSKAVVAFGLLTAVTTVVFFDGVARHRGALACSPCRTRCCPFAVLVAVRFGVAGAVFGMVLTSLVAVAGTAAGGAAVPAHASRPRRPRHRHAVVHGDASTLVSVLLALAMEQGRWQEFQTRLLNEALAEANGVLVHEIGERERTALSLADAARRDARRASSWWMRRA